jgi:hypothetical protein
MEIISGSDQRDQIGPSFTMWEELIQKLMES